MSDLSPARWDTEGKARGEAKYVDDLRFPDMLYVQAAHAAVSHARILGIRTREAAALPGVIGVFTAQDAPTINLKACDRPFLAQDKIRFYGEAFACAVAEDRRTAQAATKLIRLDAETLPAIESAEEALAVNAVLIHDSGNKSVSHLVRKGNVDEGFAAADRIIERSFATNRATHGAIEPDGVVAVPDQGGLLLYCPGKNAFGIKEAVAESLGLSQAAVRVIQPAIGGAFGGKDVDIVTIACRAGYAALRYGRPCKTVWSREEVMLEGSKRHIFHMNYKVGYTLDGKLTSLRSEILADVGAYVTKSRATIWRGAVEAAGPYRIDDLEIRMQGVYTNHPPSDSVRGLGSVQVDFAMEALMDEIAEDLGMSPYDLRRINLLRDGDTTATSQKIYGVHTGQCLEKLQEHFPLFEKRQEPGRFLRGRGVSCICRGEARGSASGESDEATVVLSLQKDGKLLASVGIAEMGQGGTEIVRQIVSRGLAADADDIRILPLDTASSPNCGPTTGSRGTITSGNAALRACEVFRSEVVKELARDLGKEESAVIYDEGGLRVDGYAVTLKSAAPVLLKKKLNITAVGRYALPVTWWNHESHSGDTYFDYNYTACGAEVIVDSMTGKITVERVVSVNDVGLAVNEEEVKGQVNGAIAMAVGLALTENAEYRNGKLLTDNLDKYLLTTGADMPATEVYLLDLPSLSNPLGVKGVGEPAGAVVAPAIVNAVYDAVGIRFRSLPLSLERVMAALEERKRNNG